MESELEKPNKSESELKEKITATKATLERLKGDDDKLEAEIFQISNSIYEELIQGPLRNSRNRGILDQDLEGALRLLRASRDELWIKDPAKGLVALDAWETQYKAKYELAKEVKDKVEDRLATSGIDEMLNRRRGLESERRLLKKELEELEEKYRDYLGSAHQGVSQISG